MWEFFLNQPENILSLTDVLPLVFSVSQVGSQLLLFQIFFQDFLEPLQKL